MSSLALPVLSNQAHCCIQSASLHPGARKSQFRCSNKNWSGNYEICEYQRHTVSQSFVSSVISCSSDLLPKMGLQNDARHDFARRIWGVHNSEMSHTHSWKWCHITNVILSSRQSKLPSFLWKHDWWNKSLCIWIWKCAVRSCVTLDQ